MRVRTFRKTFWYKCPISISFDLGKPKHRPPRSFDEISLRDSKTFGAFPRVEEACGRWLAARVRLSDRNCRRFASSCGHVHDCTSEPLETDALDCWFCMPSCPFGPIRGCGGLACLMNREMVAV